MGLDLSGFDTPAHQNAQRDCRHVIGCAVDATTRLTVITRMHAARGLNPLEVQLCIARLSGSCCLPPALTGHHREPDAYTVHWSLTVTYSYETSIPAVELRETGTDLDDIGVPGEVTEHDVDLLLSRYEHVPFHVELEQRYIESAEPTSRPEQQGDQP